MYANELIYIILFAACIMMSVVNKYYLQHNKPYPPKHIRDKIKNDSLSFLEFIKYIGFSEYKTLELLESESKWLNERAEWNKYSIKTGNYGLVILIISLIISLLLRQKLYHIGKFSGFFVEDIILLVPVMFFCVYFYIRCKIFTKKH